MIADVYEKGPSPDWAPKYLGKHEIVGSPGPGRVLEIGGRRYKVDQRVPGLVTTIGGGSPSFTVLVAPYSG